MRHLFSLLILCLTLPGSMLFSACDQKHIVMPGEEDSVVTVRFDWNKAPKANPEGATLLFFPTDNPDKEIWRFDLAGKAGGDIELPYGTYDILVVNNDLPNIDFINQTSFSLFAAEAIGDGTTLPDGTPVTLPTGMLYGTVLRNVSHSRKGFYIDDRQLGVVSQKILTMSPDSLSTLYELRVGPISIPPTLKKMSVWICGPGASMTISDEVTKGMTAVPFENLSLINGDIVHGTCTAFGSRKDSSRNYELYFMFQDDYGRTFYKKLDITEIVVNSKWNHYVYVDIGDIDFSDTIGGNTDFGNPIGVDGWENINVDHVVYFP